MKKALVLFVLLSLSACAHGPRACQEVEERAGVFLCNFDQATVLVTEGQHTIFPKAQPSAAPKPTPAATAAPAVQK